MKTFIGLMILMFLGMSCMDQSCPTYGSAQKHSAAMFTAKKASHRDRTPYYKAIKSAERD